jgi:SAM-dependent methyltransferase
MPPAEHSFEELVAEGDVQPVEGWDFSWFDGRATEQRPSWAYVRSLVPRVTGASAVLDIQTGGGEVFADVLAQVASPPSVSATESWPPNLRIARQNLRPFGGTVEGVDDDQPLPFDSGSFDLAISRHPTVTLWGDIARVLTPGGTFFSQQVGAGTNRELTEFMMGPQPVSDRHSPARATADATAAGLEVVDLRQETLDVRFNDVGAVVYFLKKVFWTVPDFEVERYLPRLRALHDEISHTGQFLSRSVRFLIEARKPG